MAQDTYHAGHGKEVDRIYQQTVIDTYSRVAFAKLYTSKQAIIAAEALNDPVIPFFEEHQIPILRVLTDQGSEFEGRPKHHKHKRYLQLKNIDHSLIRVRHPQSNGMCEWLHRTKQEECCAIAFRKTLCASLNQLQADLEGWVQHYNQERPHSSRYCYGKTPMETFLASRTSAKEKQLDDLPPAA